MDTLHNIYTAKVLEDVLCPHCSSPLADEDLQAWSRYYGHNGIQMELDTVSKLACLQCIADIEAYQSEKVRGTMQPSRMSDCFVPTPVSARATARADANPIPLQYID